MEFTYRPIVEWPGAMTPARTRSYFKARYEDTLKLLDRELRLLGAKSVVLQVALSEGDIRRDGRPRADARRPVHPGVILAFDSKHGPLSYPCDTFLSWEDNLRAIALALEHLRAVDRYGVTRRGEQYRGWAQLPPPARPAAMDPISAALHLKRFSGLPDIFKHNLAEAFRRAALATHPDRGGNEADFKRVSEAKGVLERLWGPAS